MIRLNNLLIVLLSLAGGLCFSPAVVAQSPYLLSMSTYIGSDSGDEVVGLRILSDGTIAVAANIGGAAPANPDQGPLAPVLLNGATSATSGVIIRLSRDGHTIVSVTRLADSLRDLDIDGADNLYVAAGTDGLFKLNPTASAVLWSRLNGTLLHRVAVSPDGWVAALNPTDLSSLDTAPGSGVIYLYTAEGTLHLQYNGMQNTLDVAVDAVSQTIVSIGWRNANTWQDGGSVLPVQIAYLRAHDFSGNIKWTNYSYDTSSDIAGGHTFDANGFVIITNPYYINSTGKAVGVDDSGRTTYGFVNNMADTRGYRLRMGQDGYLYAAFEAAGGNHIFRNDGRHLGAEDPDFRKLLPAAGGSFFNQFINTGSSHKTFIGKYVASSGERLLGNQYNTLVTNNSMSANALRTQRSGLAADATGRMFFGGGAASGLPLPGNIYFQPDPDEISLNPFGVSTEGGAFLWGVESDLSQRNVVARLASGWTHAVDARILDGETEPLVVWGGSTNLSRPMQVLKAWQPTPEYGEQDGFIAVLGGSPEDASLRHHLSYGGNYTASSSMLRGQLPDRYADDLSGNGQSDDWVIEYGWNPGVPLSPLSPNYTGPVFRGGYRAQLLQTSNRNFNTNSYSNSNTSIRISPASGGMLKVHGAFYFDKEDMAGISGSDVLTFDAGSYLYISCSEPGLVGSRWLVRDGAQFYVSEEIIAPTERSHMTAFPGSIDNGRWAAHTIDNSMRFDAESAVFETRFFTNITAVGFIVNKDDYDDGSVWIRWNGFQANFALNGVLNHAPVAMISAGFTGPEIAPLSVSMDASGSYDPDGPVTFVSWDPGDGRSPVGGEAVALTYTAAGSYEVTLTVWDEDMEKDSQTVTVEVVSPVAPVPSKVIASWGGDFVEASINFRNQNGSQWSVTGKPYDFLNGYEFSEVHPLTHTSVLGTRIYGGMLAKTQHSAGKFTYSRFENSAPMDGMNIRHAPNSDRPAQWHGVFYIDKLDFLGDASSQRFAFMGGARMILDDLYLFHSVGDVRFLVRDGSSYYVSQKVLSPGDSILEIPSDTDHGVWAFYDPHADHMDFDQGNAVFSTRVFSDITAVGFILDRDTFATTATHFSVRHFIVEGEILESQHTLVTGVQVTPAMATLEVGETVQLLAEVAPMNASNKNVIWSVSGDGIVTVSQSGLVTGLATGNATVTATTEDGGFTAQSVITVSEPVPVAPLSPAGLSALASSATGIDLSWQDNSDNEDGFRIERTLSGAGGWQEIALTAANVTSFSDGGLLASTSYSYRVRAYNGAGLSGYSNVADATTLAPGGASSEVFVDSFGDNDRTTNPAWYSVGSPVIGQSGGVLSLGAASSGGHKYLFSHFTGATLENVGDQLVFSFRVKLTGDQGSRNNEIAFGIGNNRGTIVTADTNTTTTYNDDLGYIAAIGTGTGTSAIIRDGGTSQFLGRLFDAADQTIISAAAASMGITSSFKDYTLTFTRTADGLDIVLSDGTTSVSVSDNAVPGNDFYTFNTVAFGYYNRNTANSVDVDRIAVSFIDANLDPGTPETFSAWIGQFPEVPPDQRGQMDNPAGDGIPNVLKYAFGLHPLEVANSGVPVVSSVPGVDGTELRLQYRRIANGTDAGDSTYAVGDLTYIPQVSFDMAAWGTLDGAASPLMEQVGAPVPDPADPGIEVVTLRLKQPVNAARSRAFLRMEVQVAE